MFDPFPQERVFESVAKRLREAIYSGKVMPGDKLPTERDLSQMFNVSRAAIRSALLNLEQSGLINIKKGAGGGSFVQELDFKPVRNSINDLIQLGKASVSELIEIRRILEPEVTYLAALRATKDDLSKMWFSIEQFEENINEGLALKPSDFDFHVCVAEGSKNNTLTIIMRALRDLIFKAVGSYNVEMASSQEIIEQHKLIFNAIKAKKPNKAKLSAMKHVTAMAKLFQNHEE
jgi:DNA-binding FadR family transcriptional regulator